jgi:hypothetical protein
MRSDDVRLDVVTTRMHGAVVVAVVVLAAGCSGTRHGAVPVGVSAHAGKFTTESTTTLPYTNVMPRLKKAVTLEHGQWYLTPPRPTDSTLLTQAVAGNAVSHKADGSPAKPIVFLARLTDELPRILKLAPGSYAPLPHDQLVVVVLEYGLNRMSAGGPTGSTGPLPTGLSSYESMLGFLDPVTGEGSFGADYPGPPPPISTTRATG